MIGHGAGDWNTSRLTMRWVQVVPHFDGVPITTSPARGA